MVLIGVILWLCTMGIVLPQDVQLSEGIYDGEPYLVVDPDDPQHLVVAWMGFYPGQGMLITTRASFDGGRSWTPSVRVPHVQNIFSSADPVLAFNAAGEVLLGYIDHNPQVPAGGVFLRRSTDGGRSWLEPVKVIGVEDDPGKMPIDRPWIATDRERNWVYVTTLSPAQYSTPPYHPYLIVSKDGGKSFQQWRYLDTAGWLAGSVLRKPMASPCVTADGVFVAVYPSYVPEQFPRLQYLFVYSTTNGVSLKYSVAKVGLDPRFPSLARDAKKAHLLRCDPSDPDHLAFFFLDAPYGHVDVWMMESFDKGKSWSAPIRVNDAPPQVHRQEDMIWADLNERGDIVVLWRDRRNAPDSTYATDFEIWAAYKPAGAAAFQPNFRVSDAQIRFDSLYRKGGNDFLSVALVQDTIYAVWSDARNGWLRVWFKKMTVDGKPIVTTVLDSLPVAPIVVLVDTPAETLRLQTLAAATVAVYAVSGKQIWESPPLPPSTTMTVDFRSLPAGVYFLSVVAGGQKHLYPVIKAQGVFRVVFDRQR